VKKGLFKIVVLSFVNIAVHQPCHSFGGKPQISTSSESATSSSQQLFTETHYGINFEADVIGKEKFKLLVQSLVDLIEHHPSQQIKKLITNSLSKNRRLKVKFVKHSDLGSYAFWNGNDKTISIAIDTNDASNLQDGFLFELVNSINPVESAYKFNLDQLNSPTENLAAEIAREAKMFAKEQECREHWSDVKFAQIQGQLPTPLEAYLAEQSEPSLQCHGFSHTEIYEYEFLVRLLPVLQAQIRLNNHLLAACSDVEKVKIIKKIELQQNAEKKMIEQVSDMKLTANDLKESKISDKKINEFFEKVKVRLDMRVKILHLCAKINLEFPNTGEASLGELRQTLMSECLRLHGEGSTVETHKLLSLGGSRMLGVYTTKNTVEQDKKFLEDLADFNKAMSQFK
jgi:hypothetical protein